MELCRFRCGTFVYGCLSLSKLRAHRPHFAPVGTKVCCCSARVYLQRPERPSGLTGKNAPDRDRISKKTSFRRISLLILGVFLPQFCFHGRIGFLLGRLS